MWVSALGDRMERDEPTPGAVVEAASARLDRSVASVTPYEEGMNAVYRVAFADGPDAVLKAGTRTEGSKLLSGPALIERLRRETDLPVPNVLAVAPDGDEHVACAYFLMEHIGGRREPDVNALSESEHRRLVREAGAHLAAIHGVPYEGPYGRLHAEDGALFVERPFERWTDYVASVSDYYAEHIDSRFEGLRPVFEGAMGRFDLDEGKVDQSILYRDYHPKNLVLEPSADEGSLVRAILDFNFRPVGDALFDVAVAETHLVDLPVGGTERAASLRDLLRSGYVDARGGAPDYFDERYPYYRLLAVADYLNYVEYAARLGRESDPERVVERLRAFVRARCAEIGLD